MICFDVVVKNDLLLWSFGKCLLGLDLIFLLNFCVESDKFDVCGMKLNCFCLIECVRDQTGDARFALPPLSVTAFQSRWSRSQRSGSVAVCAATVAAGTVTGGYAMFWGYVGYLFSRAVAFFRRTRTKQQPDACRCDGQRTGVRALFRMIWLGEHIFDDGVGRRRLIVAASILATADGRLRGTGEV